MEDALKQVVTRWFEEVWNQGRRETIDELLGPACVLHECESDLVGPESFKAFYDQMQSILSEIRVQPELQIREGDHVLTRWVSTATVRSTGQAVRIHGMSLIRFEDGQFAEGWQNWDQHGLMEQMNAVPMKAAAQTAG